MKYLAELRVLLHKATQTGDELRWTFSVATEGDYLIALDHYQSPSYGQAQLLVDGGPVGEAVAGTAETVRAAPMARLGQVHLSAGEHQAALRATKDDGAGHYWFGFRALWLLPGGEAAQTEPQPFIRSAQRLACAADGPIAPAGALVMLDGNRYDVVLSAADAEAERTFAAGARTFSLQGAFAHLRADGNEPTEAHLVGTRRLAFSDLEFSCAEAQHTGTVRSTDAERAAFETDAKLPTDGRLNEQVILFSNAGYSRNTAYRIARTETLQDGSRVILEGPSFVLGTGILEDDPPNEHEFISLLAHEYARSDSIPGTQFLSGKLIRGPGFATRIIRTQFGQLMRCEVDSTQGMGAGDEFAILDVQAGDSFSIPTLAHLRRSTDGTFSGTATTEVAVRRNGALLATIKPG
jgi:hypothetical protein